ncbi:MAG: hypothetical protein HQL31_12005, partial [Planctomycetes bacterium]|nr:hypothetical protein [Planctomycetota bacterium]
TLDLGVGDDEDDGLGKEETMDLDIGEADMSDGGGSGGLDLDDGDLTLDVGGSSSSDATLSFDGMDSALAEETLTLSDGEDTLSEDIDPSLLDDSELGGRSARGLQVGAGGPVTKIIDEKGINLFFTLCIVASFAFVAYLGFVTTGLVWLHSSETPWKKDSAFHSIAIKA